MCMGMRGELRKEPVPFLCQLTGTQTGDDVQRNDSKCIPNAGMFGGVDHAHHAAVFSLFFPQAYSFLSSRCSVNQKQERAGSLLF